MLKRLCLLLCVIPLSAMDSPKTRQESEVLAETLSLQLFQHRDPELVSVFTRILLKDKRHDEKLTETRRRMTKILKEFYEVDCRCSSSSSR